MRPEYRDWLREWHYRDRGRGFMVTEEFVEMAYPQYLRDLMRQQNREGGAFIISENHPEPIAPPYLPTLEEFIVILANEKWRQQHIKPQPLPTYVLPEGVP